MSDTNFIPTQTTVAATWCQDVNDVVYRLLGASTGPGGVAPTDHNQILDNLGSGPVCTSIASLRALLKTENKFAFVLGYYGVGDGGGGAYYYDATDTTSADNGGTIIVATDGGRWKLSYTGVVSVKQFGATGNGTTSDYTAIQTAANTVDRLYAPAGIYLIDHPLNFTNRTKPLIITGDGGYYQQNTGTVFLFKTGSWMVDCTGCQFSHFEHMRWVADGLAGSSTLGILYARSTVQNFSMYNTAYKMVLELASSAGSAVGSIGLADNCAENFSWDQCWIVADAPYVSTLANELSLASPYATIANTIFSDTDKSFRQCVFQARNNYANVFYGLADTTFDQCNWTLLGALGAGVNAAMVLNPSASGYLDCSNLRFTGDFESFPAIAYLAGNTRNLNFDCTTANLTGAASLVSFNGLTHDNIRVKVNQLSGSQTNLMSATGPGVVLNNAEIYMAIGQTLLDGNITLQGGMVYGGGNDLSNTGILSVNAASSFRATYINSTLRGSVSWTPGSVPGNSSVVTLVSVPNVVGGSTVRVYPPYAIPFCVASGYVASTGSVEIVLSNVNGSASASFGAGTWVVEVDKVYA